MVVLFPTPQSYARAEAAIDALEAVRGRTTPLIHPHQRRRRRAPTLVLVSPLAWDLGHIAACKHLWISGRVGGPFLLRPEVGNL